MAISKDELIEAVKSMTVLELSDLVKALQEEFGVALRPPQWPAVATTTTTAAPEPAGADGI